MHQQNTTTGCQLQVKQIIHQQAADSSICNMLTLFCLLPKFAVLCVLCSACYQSLLYSAHSLLYILYSALLVTRVRCALRTLLCSLCLSRQRIWPCIQRRRDGSPDTQDDTRHGYRRPIWWQVFLPRRPRSAASSSRRFMPGDSL